jgi:hypothetical protein
MPISALTDFARTHPSVPPPYYAAVHLRYILDLDDQGRLRGVIDTGNQRRLWRRPAPSVGRTVGIRPLLLADTVEYTFGLPYFPEQHVRAQACRQAYLQLLERCYSATLYAPLRAVLHYLHHDGDRVPLSSDCDRRALVTFRVNGRLIVDAAEIQQFWAAMLNEQAETREGVCSLCRRTGAIPRRSSERVRGLPGAATVGSPLISVNLAAAESHGLTNAHVTGVCGECQRLAGWALDYLLDQPEAMLSVAGYTSVLWLSNRQTVPLNQLLTGISYEDVDRVRRQLERSAGQADICCLSLTSQGGRMRVLDYFRVPVAAALTPINEWIAIQAGHDDSGAGKLVGIHQLASVYNRSLRTPTHGMVQALIRHAFLGEAVPAVEAAAVLQAALIDPPVSRARRTVFQICWPVGGHYQPTSADHHARALGRLVGFAERLRAHVRGGRSAAIRVYRDLLHDPQHRVPPLLIGLQAVIAELEHSDPPAAAHAAALLRRYASALGRPEQPLPAVPFLRGYLHEHSRNDMLSVQPAADSDTPAPSAGEDHDDSSGDLRDAATL